MIVVLEKTEKTLLVSSEWTAFDGVRQKARQPVRELRSGWFIFILFIFLSFSHNDYRTLSN